MFEPKKITLKDSEQYQWGQKGAGWFLFKSDDLTVVEEELAPGVKEINHYHERSWQFFYIISGEATLSVDGKDVKLGKDESIQVPPLVKHQLMNNGTIAVKFIIISKPNSYNDRVIVD